MSKQRRRSEAFVAKLDDPEYRHAFMEAHTQARIAMQIRTIRAQRGWSQAELAARLATKGSVVSRLESPDYGKMTVTTLLSLAAAFDCGLQIRFADYPTWLEVTDEFSEESLRVAAYSESVPTPPSNQEGGRDDAGDSKGR